MKKFIVVVSTGTFFMIFPQRYFNKTLKTIANKKECNQYLKEYRQYATKNRFYYFVNKNRELYFSTLYKLWFHKKLMLKERKYSYFTKEAQFKLLFLKNGRISLDDREFNFSKSNTIEIDRKRMNFGKFLRYFGERSFNEGTLNWDFHTKKHFKLRNKGKTLPKIEKLQKNKTYFLDNLAKLKDDILKNKKLHITKLKFMDRIYDLKNNIPHLLNRFIANKIVENFLNGKSIYKKSSLPYKTKKEILLKAQKLIEDSFDESKKESAVIEIAKMLEEIDDLLSTKRLYSHARRINFSDGDILSMRQCLYFYEPPQLIYPVVRQYCSEYHDLRYRVTHYTIDRISEIEEFIKNIKQG